MGRSLSCLYSISPVNKKLQSSACSYLFAFLCGFDINLGSLLKGLPENMSDQRFTSNLHGDHVPGSLQDCLWSGELTANVVFGQLNRLSRELLRLVSLVTVSQIFTKLLWSQAKLLCQTIYMNNDQTKRCKHGKKRIPWHWDCGAQDIRGNWPRPTLWQILYISLRDASLRSGPFCSSSSISNSSSSPKE